MVDEQQTKCDIFVSYRHVADESDEKWVTQFCSGLETKLDELLGDQVRFWRDNEKIRAGDEWRPEIDKALESAAIFLAIISQSYFRSEVCRQEMDRFLGLYKQANEATPRLIFPIFKQPPTLDVPPDINEIHRPRMFYQDNPPGYDEFAPGRKTNSDFWDALGKVAQELKVQLGKIHERVRPRTIGTVYLGEVGRESQREREAGERSQRHERHRVRLLCEQTLERPHEVEDHPRRRHVCVTQPRCAMGLVRHDEGSN